VKFTDITSWLSGTDVLFGLEVYVNKEQEKEYRLVHISKKDGNLVSNSFSTYASIEEVLTAVPENSPLVLIWNGKGVIHRNFAAQEQSTAEIAKTLFPDIKSDDFLYQQTRTASGGILSLIRKELITELLETFNKNKISVVAVSTGPFVVPAFFQLLGEFSKDLIYDYYRIQTNSDGSIIEYIVLSENNTSTVTIADENIDGIYLNAYAAACLLLLTSNKIEYPKVEDGLIDTQVKNYKDSILKRRGGMVFLTSILVILLINFAVFSNLRKQQMRYEDQLAVSQSKLKRLDSLETFIKTKKDFLEKAGWIEKVVVSKECDEIAQTIPTEIRLTELTIHPINISESRNTKETIFSNKKIVIKGLTKKVTSLNDWLKIVSQRASIKDLHMEEYHFDTQTQEGQFKLEGTIN